jgi:hypothetical protein
MYCLVSAHFGVKSIEVKLRRNHDEYCLYYRLYKRTVPSAKIR